MAKSIDNAIEARAICKRFDRVLVLDNVDFSLASGEIHAVVGSNGAGKSTLMKILNGVHAADSGVMRFFGQEVTLRSSRDAHEAGLAMVYQELSLIPTLTVSQNVFLTHYPHKNWLFIDDKKNHQRVAQLLEMVGVQANISPTDIVDDLSSGQRQVIEIVKALASEPKVLILDEPTASLAVKEIDSIFSTINKLKENGISVIYISHYLQDIFTICDSVTVLRDGRQVFSGYTKDTSLQAIIAEMVGKMAVQRNTARDRRTAHSGTPLLEMRDVCTEKIDHVSLQVRRGEMVGIAGLLGSGRSEIFNALLGLDRITSGEILIDGVKQNYRTPHDAIEAGIVLVPENRRKKGLIMEHSVQHNMFLSALKRFTRWRSLLNGRQIESVVKQQIEALSIKTQTPAQLMKFLSGGNQQKVVISKCLITRAPILLLDDPTFGIDLLAKQEIMDIIRRFVDDGNAVVFVSSEYKEIIDLCDTIYTVRRGTITNTLDNNITEQELLYCLQ